jgi:hypothetical protein
MRLSAVEDHEIDELPPEVAEAFEAYIADALALVWQGPHRDTETVRRFRRFLEARHRHGKQETWRWGNSIWRLSLYGVERVAG